MSNNSKILTRKDAEFEDMLEHAWMELGDIRKLKYNNPLLGMEWSEGSKTSELLVNLCRDPAYIHFVCRYILNVDILPYQGVILSTLWDTPLPMFLGSRGSAKSFTIAIYIILRAMLQQGCTIAVVGAGLRQSMVIYSYIESIWYNAPILRDICGGKNYAPKKEIHLASWKCGDSNVRFFPLGTGDKIRGQRANVVCCDEFSSVNETIFETVVRGFAAVKSGGVKQGVSQVAKKKLMESLNIINEIEVPSFQPKVSNVMFNNQIIISGTAYYQFNHFYKYYKLYKAIIESGGDPNVLRQEFPDQPLDQVINPADYAIIRLPYDKVPEGMMDPVILSQGRATMDPTTFDMEYGCVFPADSDGFILASHLNRATCPIIIDNKAFTFPAKLIGDTDKIYMMGIDPASEEDNFAISIIEINDNKRFLVYTWTTNRKDFEQMKRDGWIKDGIEDYHTFCIKHIRKLLRRFNIQLISCDASGGGASIKEGLKDPDKMEHGDQPILDMEDENNFGKEGLKILKMIEFSSHAWRREAHYGLKKDISEQILLFPEYDISAIAAMSLRDDYESLEDVYLEIIECKTETTFIKHNVTATGNEQWDVPDIKGVDSEAVKKRLKRDRFTSLLLANWSARSYLTVGYQPNTKIYQSVKRGTFTPSTGKPKIQPTIINRNGRKIYR